MGMPSTSLSWTVEWTCATKLLSPIGRVIKVDADSKEVSNGLFARTSLEVDISKPFKMESKYYNSLIDYENTKNICYRCGRQEHKFDTYRLNAKCVSFKVERLQGYLKKPTLQFIGKKSNKNTKSRKVGRQAKVATRYNWRQSKEERQTRRNEWKRFRQTNRKWKIQVFWWNHHWQRHRKINQRTKRIQIG